MIKRLYPDGKKKAFNITYDDGVLQDVPFVELLDKYGIKGTFNLNSEFMENEFEWQHEKGFTVKRLSSAVAAGMYTGHEVASHTLTHPYMHNMAREEVLWQLGKDKENLEKLFGRKIRGFGVPFDYYSDMIADCARRCGFEYARNSQQTLDYTPCGDYYNWSAGIFHLNPKLKEYINGFFETDRELALCQIVGHSYDLDAENMWQDMEEILERIAADSDTASMTHEEIVAYLKAIRSAEITDNCIVNKSDTTLWFEVNDAIVSVAPFGKHLMRPG